MSLQSRRSGGPRMAGHPSRRSLPNSQKSKKSISSQVWGGGNACWPRTTGARTAPRRTCVCPGLGNPTSPRMFLLALTMLAVSSAVQSLPETADGDAGQHHIALHPLHQTQRWQAALCVSAWRGWRRCGALLSLQSVSLLLWPCVAWNVPSWLGHILDQPLFAPGLTLGEQWSSYEPVGSWRPSGSVPQATPPGTPLLQQSPGCSPHLQPQHL